MRETTTFRLIQEDWYRTDYELPMNHERLVELVIEEYNGCREPPVRPNVIGQRKVQFGKRACLGKPKEPDIAPLPAEKAC